MDKKSILDSLIVVFILICGLAILALIGYLCGLWFKRKGCTLVTKADPCPFEDEEELSPVAISPSTMRRTEDLLPPPPPEMTANEAPLTAPLLTAPPLTAPPLTAPPLTAPLVMVPPVTARTLHCHEDVSYDYAGYSTAGYTVPRMNDRPKFDGVLQINAQVPFTLHRTGAIELHGQKTYNEFSVYSSYDRMNECGNSTRTLYTDVGQNEGVSASYESPQIQVNVGD